MSRRSGKGIPASPSKNDTEDEQKKLLAADSGHFTMIRALHLADLITIMNGLCGFMSILSSMRYCLSLPASTRSTSAASPLTPSCLGDATQAWIALGLVPLGLLFDFMDGRVARWRHKSSAMGAELDSLADLVSFGVAPASAAFAVLGIRSVLDTCFLSFFVLCGLARLARFNVTSAAKALPTDASGKQRFFEGFPIPTSLVLVAAMAECLRRGLLAEKIPGGVFAAGTWLELHPVVLLFALWGCAMVSRTIHVPKP